MGKRILIIYALLSAFVVCSAVEVPEYAKDTVLLQELSVSAIKQGHDIKNKPVASTIIGRVEAERLNMLTLKGVSDVVPNFYIPDYGSRMTSSIYVRGIGARMEQPAVGLNVDNVPFMNKDAYDFDLVDICKVEMLRGPQATLYGRNTMGGLINITTLSPLQFQGLRFLAEYAGRNSLRASVGWYVMPRSNLGLSVTGYYTRTDGFFRNQYNGKKLDKEQQWSIRQKTEWRIAPKWLLQNTFAVSGLRQGGYPYEYLPTQTIAYNDTCFYRRFTLNDGLTVKWTGSNLSVSSITSVQYINDNMTLDQDFLPEDYFTLTQKKQEWAVTQDFVAKGKVAERYVWTSGVFGFYKHTDMQAPVTFCDEGISKLIEEHNNSSNPYYPIRWDTRSFLLDSNFTNPTFGIAAYHQSELNLGGWHISAGLRLDYERADLNYASYCNTSYTVYQKNLSSGDYSAYMNVPVFIDDSDRLHRDFLELLPKFGVVWDLPSMTNSNVYANISKGYKAGGFNTQMFSDVLQQKVMGYMGIGGNYKVQDIVSYKPEKSWNYEVGAHLECASGKVNTDLSLFYIDCRDQQLTMFPDGNTTGRIMTNAGKTRSYGCEVSVDCRLIPQMLIRCSYGYTNAKFRVFNNGKEDFAGKYIPYAPSNTFFAEIAYTLPLQNNFFRSLSFDMNVKGTGPVYWNEANTASQNFYALLGASVTLAGEHYSLELWGRNLTDTKYHTFYFVSIGNEFVQRGNPVNIGATLRINI